jgi:glyoxylase-like metal-dependent hydrolase (beta-lactamase superfamily II)/ferredoxin
MARAQDRLAENAAGDLFVDSSCIDCDTCRWLAPAVFDRSRRGLSFVRRQPAGGDERRRALMALVSCPTSSIGSASKDGVTAAAAALPDEIAPDLFYCGYASESSYGASAYLLRRPGGNVLVDSPRASRPLLARLEALGGVATMFLTHRDDVADHRVFAKHFGCRRVLHADDVSAGTRDVELQPRGRGPVRLGDDLTMIPVPGHTRGSAALLVGDAYLFTGDHLWWDDDLPGLDMGREVCWWSWREQLASLARLAEHRFRWVLPGHGRRWQATSHEAMQDELRRCLSRCHGQ